MELKNKRLKPEASGNGTSSLRKYLTASVIAAGLAVLPSCGGSQMNAETMPAETMPETDPVVIIGLPKHPDCTMAEPAPPRLSESEQNGLSIQFKTETNVVKQGDSVKVMEIQGNELYVKVVKVADDGLGFSFNDKNRDSVWLVQYGEERSIGEFLLRITVKAERCPDGGNALLTVTYPVGYTEMRKTTESKLSPLGSLDPLPYHSPEADRRSVAGLADAKTSMALVRAGDYLVGADCPEELSYLRQDGLKIAAVSASGILLRDGTSIGFGQTLAFKEFVLKATIGVERGETPLTAKVSATIQD